MSKVELKDENTITFRSTAILGPLGNVGPLGHAQPWEYGKNRGRLGRSGHALFENIPLTLEWFKMSSRLFCAKKQELLASVIMYIVGGFPQPIWKNMIVKLV